QSQEDLRAELKQRQEDLRAELKQGQEDLKAELKQDIRVLNQRVAVLERAVNDHMSAIREGLEGFAERGRQIDRLERKYNSHDDRIWALEQYAKSL
ncbi:MAG: hypothetical protein LBU86_07285, partial [Oscillospiraceae bacterium]|nr:hypothetical protein [Oscillospiraceae bacterium]